MVAVSFLREWLDTLMSQAAEGLAFSRLLNERTLPHHEVAPRHNILGPWSGNQR